MYESRIKICAVGWAIGHWGEGEGRRVAEKFSNSSPAHQNLRGFAVLLNFALSPKKGL